jgi:hypothetical protein
MYLSQCPVLGCQVIQDGSNLFFCLLVDQVVILSIEPIPPPVSSRAGWLIKITLDRGPTR